MRVSGSFAVAIIAAALIASAAEPEAPATGKNSASPLVAILQGGVEASQSEAESTSDAIARLEEAARSVLEEIPAQSPVAVRLERALKMDGTDETRLARLQTAARTSIDQLAFEPVHEAEQPEGFPPYTPAGLLEVKEYPAYRMAVANGFWTLFTHIKSNDIGMTAPVEMTFDSPDDKTLKQTSMAFLYGDPDLGSTGRKGNVEVVDVEPATVVSLGMRGRRTSESSRQAQATLQAWLDAHPEYEQAGDFRIMGYNSPYVPADKQFWEAQLIISRRNAE
ncbi:SOUL heme-binding protein [Maioricimonas rarisocia]|uniref:SOUL heme-binding protein n=1 Tax=Maioricimonas rarisocia TaxID=2528026 RepID=A0A517Z357_9PLAN|nr:heme-binding protein [Maioricimonas rarisocia]QDU36903.1 SOUL heme-binding protein [Maioricimonas rarisocia]